MQVPYNWSDHPPAANSGYAWRGVQAQSRSEVRELFHSPGLQQAAAQLCQLAGLLWQRGHVNGFGGNLALRVSEDLVLCTPKLMLKALLQPQDLCLVDLQARQKYGKYQCTSEINCHLAMMLEIGVDCSILASPPHAMLLLAAGLNYRSGLGCEQDMFVKEVARAEFALPASHGIAANVALASRRSPLVYLQNHALLAGAGDPSSAYAMLEYVEYNAMLQLKAQACGVEMSQIDSAATLQLQKIREQLLPCAEESKRL